MAKEKIARMLPNDLEAEQALLGCLFLSQDACMEVFSMIKPTDFYSKNLPGNVAELFLRHS